MREYLALTDADMTDNGHGWGGEEDRALRRIAQYFHEAPTVWTLILRDHWDDTHTCPHLAPYLQKLEDEQKSPREEVRDETEAATQIAPKFFQLPSQRRDSNRKHDYAHERYETDNTGDVWERDSRDDSLDECDYVKWDEEFYEEYGWNLETENFSEASWTEDWVVEADEDESKRSDGLDAPWPPAWSVNDEWMSNDEDEEDLHWTQLAAIEALAQAKRYSAGSTSLRYSYYKALECLAELPSLDVIEGTPRHETLLVPVPILDAAEYLYGPTTMPSHPKEGKFDEDPRVHIDKLSGRYQYEDEESGQEFEWSEAAKAWIPLVDEDQWKAQQAAYSVAGVDESTPANAVVAREERRNKKRKKGEDGGLPAPNPRASSSKQSQPSAPKNTAVWVTNLPPDADTEKIASVFSKAGVLLIGDDGAPRIKMYYNDEGKFTGEALVMYFKEGSVSLAITLLDDTELEMGAGHGTMKVREAEYGAQSGSGSGGGASKSNGEKKEGGDGGNAEGGPSKKKKPPTAEEKLRMTKRIRRMQDKLTWHSDSDSDDAGAPAAGAPKPGANRMNRVVVLKGMFKPEDLEKEPELLLELKEDVREEAETLGTVTSVTLYDREEDGVMTIKFKEAVAAEACVMKMNGRWFDGRQIHAGIYTGRERYRKSGGGGFDEDGEEEEAERLNNFAQWLVDGDEGD